MMKNQPITEFYPDGSQRKWFFHNGRWYAGMLQSYSTPSASFTVFGLD